MEEAAKISSSSIRNRRRVLLLASGIGAEGTRKTGSTSNGSKIRGDFSLDLPLFLAFVKQEKKNPVQEVVQEVHSQGKRIEDLDFILDEKLEKSCCYCWCGGCCWWSCRVLLLLLWGCHCREIMRGRVSRV